MALTVARVARSVSAWSAVWAIAGPDGRLDEVGEHPGVDAEPIAATSAPARSRAIEYSPRATDEITCAMSAIATMAPLPSAVAATDVTEKMSPRSSRPPRRAASSGWR